MNSSPRPKPNRPVKPRKPVTVEKPIIAVHGNEVLLERTGDTHSYDELPQLIVREPSSIIIAHQVGHLLRDMDKQFSDNPLWQFRVSPVEREVWGPNRKYKTTIRDTTVNFFGFKGKNKKKGHYHFPISPMTFCLKTVDSIRRGLPEGNKTLFKMMFWGQDLREFLQENELALKPTSGGIAAQLLRDKRFYPDARRKVPLHTNRIGREKLPGNFYKLYAAEVSETDSKWEKVEQVATVPSDVTIKDKVFGYKATYLDQTSAHHSATSELSLPCANTLRRRGRFSTLEDKPYARAGTEKYDRLIKQHGLFYLAMECPRFLDNAFPLPECGDKDGYTRGFFYSNELPYLLELGVRIRHIIACWTSPDKDEGLNKYAKWAIRQIAKSKAERKPWLKPTLLSTYGVLAAKPKKLEFGYKRAENSFDTKYPCGSGFIDVQARRMQKLHEMPSANVIHRGMIEAETRLRSLKLAKELAKQGHTILAIYADSIFVEDGKQLPLLPHPWRVQAELTGLHFQSATHFSSRELTKQPGIPQNARKRPKLPARPTRLDKAA